MSLKIRKTLDREGIVRLLEDLGNRIGKREEIELSGTRILLPERVEVELEYKEKHGRSKLEIEFQWEEGSTRGVTETPSSRNNYILSSRKIATLNELSPWKVIHFPYPTDSEDAILIVLPDGELRAYSTVCPHKGKVLTWDDQAKRLYCPAHGAVFDPVTGEKLKGPGDPSLARIHLRVEGDGVFAVGINRRFYRENSPRPSPLLGGEGGR